jgi:hypothetical protein
MPFRREDLHRAADAPTPAPARATGVSAAAR